MSLGKAVKCTKFPKPSSRPDWSWADSGSEAMFDTPKAVSYFTSMHIFLAYMDTPAMPKATVGSGIKKKKKKSAQHYVKSITRATIEQEKK